MPAPLGAFVAFWSFLTRFVVSDATPAIGAVDGAIVGMGFSGLGAFSPDKGCSKTTESLRALSVLRGISRRVDGTPSRGPNSPKIEK